VTDNRRSRDDFAPAPRVPVRVEHGNPAYPEPFRGPVRGLVRRRLGEAFGLTAFGTNLLELEPGGLSSQKHWHSLQDELVFVLDGQVRLITDDFELDLGPGDFFGFKAGVQNGHHLKNTGTATARLIEIGSREAGDRVTYSDIDMIWLGDGTDGRGGFFRKDGSRY